MRFIRPIHGVDLDDDSDLGRPAVGAPVPELDISIRLTFEPYSSLLHFGICAKAEADLATEEFLGDRACRRTEWGRGASGREDQIQHVIEHPFRVEVQADIGTLGLGCRRSAGQGIEELDEVGHARWGGREGKGRGALVLTDRVLVCLLLRLAALPDKRVSQIFAEKGYKLSDVRESGIAPRIYLMDIPLDMAASETVATKKDLFIRILLPLVLKANEEIADQRRRLRDLHEQKTGAAGQTAWLQVLAQAYGGSVDDIADLLARVDTIPPSLALAQGIDESGWGASRFAREGESLSSTPWSQEVKRPSSQGVAVMPAKPER